MWSRVLVVRVATTSWCFHEPLAIQMGTMAERSEGSGEDERQADGSDAADAAGDEAPEAAQKSDDDAEEASAGSDDDDAEEASAESDDDAEEASADEDADRGRDQARKDRGQAAERKTSKLWWALPILMLVEFYMYGHNGRLEICVGKDGDTDFSLVGQERTDENRWKFPRCETRLNLGLRSEREARVEEGIKVACRGATIFRHQGEAKACVSGDKGWIHQVEGHFVPPWDKAYYQHLFWFLQ